MFKINVHLISDLQRTKSIYFNRHFTIIPATIVAVIIVPATVATFI